MGYLNNLQWQKALSDFDDDQKKVLLALSHDSYAWRTKERIARTTGLPASKVDDALSQLISKDRVRPSISKKKNVIFGLRERVG